MSHDKCLYFVLNATLCDKNREKLKPWFFYLKLPPTALACRPSERMTGIKLDFIKDYPKDHRLMFYNQIYFLVKMGEIFVNMHILIKKMKYYY